MGSLQVSILFIGSVIACVCIAVGVLHSRYKKRRQLHMMKRQQRQVEDELGTVADPVPRASKSKPDLQLSMPAELFAIYIMARDDCYFKGYELLQALFAAGFHHSDLKTFQRHEHTNGEGVVLFSVAQAEKPGTFDLPAMEHLQCPGLVMFMQTQEYEDNVAIYDLMVETARQLADDLDGILFDANHHHFNSQSQAYYRHRMRQYE